MNPESHLPAHHTSIAWPGRLFFWLYFFSLALVLASCKGTSAVPTPSLSSQPVLATPPATPVTELDSEAQKLARTIGRGCTAFSPRPTPGPTEQSLFPAPSPLDWTRGNPSADVNIIEYCDFQAVPCAQFALVMAQALLDFPGQVRWVYRHYPLAPINDKAQLAVQAAEAAGKQGQFWQMHDLLYSRQSEWSSLSQDEFVSWVVQQATTLEMDSHKFETDLQSSSLVQIAQQAWETNSRIGIPGTPFVLLNNQIWPAELPLNYYTLRDYIRLALLEKRQFESCPPMVIEPQKSYTAVLHTEKGDILIQLFTDQAPIAVNNFVFLARNGWYDGVRFHRVLAGLLAQTGDPSDSGYGNPGYAFVDEINPQLSFDQPGRVAMANSGKDSNGSQFFITMTATPQYNGRYTIFGQVIQGMEVVQSLTLRDPSQFPPPPPGDLILSVSILEQ
jgi:cyclophilin family peptidyl-prolyl cis-trans isomerase/protein-disulfide isomerase